MASVDINIVGATAPFTYSVKDENQNERFISYNSGKIYFNEIQDGANHTYTVRVTKGDCVITNSIILYSCNSSTPTPTVPASCVAPTIVFNSRTDKVISVNVVDGSTSNCSGYTFQWSTTFDFQFVNEQSTTCVTSQYITVPTYGTWYLRIKKKCTDNSISISNVISVNVQQPSVPIPVPVNVCSTVCDLYNVYSDNAWGIQYVDCYGEIQQAYGTPFSSSQICACSGTIEELYGGILVTLQQAGGCNITPTPVPIPIPIPIPVVNCKQVVFNITLNDIQAADGALLFGVYKDCNGVVQQKTFNSAGTFTYCSNNDYSFVNLYMYINGVQTEPNTSTYNINTTSC